ncbi:MAG: hypothetical protein JW787_15940 [Sedimentisphaerales bacterium]|nr:hypothetical protein [Sedimentisphaerales bacterium]
MAVIPNKRKTSKRISGLAPEIQAAIDYGIDISLLESNLRLNCTQRALRHQIALDTFQKLRKAKLQ